MDVITDLTAAEIFAAQVRSIHALWGTYYREIRLMDTRTILKVEMPDNNATLLHLSDGSTAQFGSFIASSENGGCILVELRAADGSLTGDGPVLTDDIRAQFTALGVENIPIATPFVIRDNILEGANRAIVLGNTPGGASGSVSSSDAPTPAHAGHATVLRQFADKIERGVPVALHAIMAALHEVEAAVVSDLRKVV